MASEHACIPGAGEGVQEKVLDLALSHLEADRTRSSESMEDPKWRAVASIAITDYQDSG